jgi:hypothetical protein
MKMRLFLEIAGSIASLMGIPLAWYFYLRTRRNAYERAREEISRTVSYQLGEGREISAFEVMAVIESITRGARVPADEISFDEVVDDLVTETISNPMLEGNRKAEITKNLREIHSTSQSWQAVSKYGLSVSDLLLLAKRQGRHLDKRDVLAVEAPGAIQPVVEIRARAPDLVALFGVFSLLLGIVGIILSTSFAESSTAKLFFWPFRPRTLAVNLIQGLIITVGAWFLAKGAGAFLKRDGRAGSRKGKLGDPH